MKPDFKNIDIKSLSGAVSPDRNDVKDWEKNNGIAKDWMTPELIPVKSA